MSQYGGYATNDLSLSEDDGQQRQQQQQQGFGGHAFPSQHQQQISMQPGWNQQMQQQQQFSMQPGWNEHQMQQQQQRHQHFHLQSGWNEQKLNVQQQQQAPEEKQTSDKPSCTQPTSTTAITSATPGTMEINQDDYDDTDDMFASGILAGSAHPITIIFHLLFKGLAIFFYLFGMFITGGNYVIVVVTVILSLSFDFWVVKNVSGRMLVGLRWWNRVDALGNTSWIFESREDTSKVNKVDSHIFWTSIYVTPMAWVSLSIVSILKGSIQWLMVDAVALALGGTNMLGYWKCSSSQQQKMKGMVQDGLNAGIMHALKNTNIRSKVWSYFTSFGGKKQNTSHQSERNHNGSLV